MKDFLLADGPIFRQAFYTTPMAYDRREREPFPPVNIYYWGRLVLIQALLPGVRARDVDVRFEKDMLILEGAIPHEEGRYCRVERYSGPFCRKINLGVAVQGRPRLLFQNGILQVIFRRKESA